MSRGGDDGEKLTKTLDMATRWKKKGECVRNVEGARSLMGGAGSCRSEGISAEIIPIR